MKLEHIPFSPPRLSLRLREAWNLFYAPPKRLAFQLCGHGWSFASNGAAKARLWRVRLYCRLGDQDLVVFLNSLPPLALEGSGLEELDASLLSKLPTELAAAVLEAAAAEFVPTLSAALGLPLVVEDMNLEEEEADLPPETLCFSLLRDDGQRLVGAFAAGEDTLLDLAQLVAEHAELLPSEGQAFGAELLPCRILLSGSELTVAELESLEPGDILILPPPISFGAPLPVTLGLYDTHGAPALLTDGVLHLEGSMMELDSPAQNDMDETLAEPLAEEEEQQGQAVFSTGQLPLRLSFDLGGVALSLDDVAALAPGSVLPTGRDMAAPVRILVSGRTIGTGSLVDVAGQMGVRVETCNLK
ncbi:type III secretion system cytoplasmic ring protein SctQ [Desulfovibrio sp. OttesenSCG-928-F20]|nr:type III secretion system cytoplasmic ring protein SctQ [Desulfovibrio sp. OttesenSCG-928-F20]